MSKRVLMLSCLPFVAIVGCGDGATSPHRPNVTFAFAGVTQRACEVIGLQSCTDTTFGTGVAPGTPISGRIMFDSNAAPVVVLENDTYFSIRYFGVSVELTVGSTTFHGNDPATTYIELDGLPNTETWNVTATRGFPSGRLAGLSVDFLTVSVPIVPSRFPDRALPEDPAIFGVGIQQGDGAGIGIKHQSEPALASFGLVAPGTLLPGHITTVARP